VKTQTHEITVDINDPIYVSELAEYLQLFGAFYDAFRADLYQMTAGKDEPGEDDPILQPFRDPLHEDFERRAHWAQTALRFIGYPMTRHPEEALAIDRMRYECPLLIIAAGIPIAVTAAAIFSGGKVKIGSFKVSLRPIGEGIRALREALGWAHALPPRFPRRSHPH
jgi:hypothetical protein